MPKKIETIPKKTTSKPQVNSVPSLPETNESVDIKGWFKKDTHEDPRIDSLIRIVRWQGRILVILIFALVISIGVQVLDINIQLPNQEALQSAPPIELEKIEYNSLTYQNDQQIHNGETVNSPEIVILGQILEGKQVMKEWPDIQMLINNASVPITGQNYQYKITLNLHPGPNVIETSLRLNGVLYNRRQRVIYYEPNQIDNSQVTTTSNENVSNQATVPTGR
jgi:hypothetical protein